MSVLSTAVIDELRLRLRGGAHLPGEAEYADACRLFNTMIERQPALVARCAAPDDVIAALDVARRHELPVAVRAGGHSVAGLSLCDDGIVLDLRPMDDVTVDPQRRIARVGGGATWSQVDAATQEHCLATTGGRVSTTGVAGLTLGGGSGWLERRHGLACDSLVAAELVTADGRLVRADGDDHPELLWALRGGGGNFGVVTALEFALHPVEAQIVGGLALWPYDRGQELLGLFRDTMRDAPEGLSLAFAYFTAPVDDDIPAELRGRPVAAIAGMYDGPVAEADALLAGIRAASPALDAFETTTYAAFNSSLDDPPGYRNWWTAEHLADLTPEAIETIHARAADLPGEPAQLFIVAWGGAMSRVGDDHSPLRARRPGFVVHPLLLWSDPADDERNIAHGRAYRDDLRSLATGDAYLNFLGDEGEDRRVAQFGAANHRRLTEIKAAWDPENLFSGNQNIRPATHAGVA